MREKLTDKQEMFCKEYLIDLNATQAAIRAGYSENSANEIGSENLSKPSIRERIHSLMQKRYDKIDLTAEYVLGNIIAIGERCMQRTPVMVHDGKEWKQKTEFNDKGEEVGVWEFKEVGALKAQELLGKHMKLFGSDVNFNPTMTVVMPSIKTSDGKELTFNVGVVPDATKDPGPSGEAAAPDNEV